MVEDADRGIPFLTLNGKTSKWVTRHFKDRVETDSQGKVFVTHEHQTPVSERLHFSEFILDTVSLPPRASVYKQMVSHDVLLMRSTLCGFHLWWSAPSFLGIWGLIPKNESTSRALHNNRWGSWTRLANKCGLDPRCLRKAAVTRHAVVTDKETQNPERLWNASSFATHFLLRLLGRGAWAHDGGGGLGTTAQRDASKDALDSLLRVVLDKECRCLLSPVAQWLPPRRPFADDGVSVDCARNKFDFRAVLAAFPRWEAPLACMKSACFKCDEQGQVDILILLQAAEAAGSKAEPFLNQLIWSLGCAIEDVLVPGLWLRASFQERANAEREKKISASEFAAKPTDELAPSPKLSHSPPLKGESDCQVPLGDAGAPTYRLDGKPCSSVENAYQMMQYLDSYARGALKLFKDELQLSIAIDGSRVARKALLLCAMAKPTGEAAWAPPQVSSDYLGESCLAILGGDDDEIEDPKQAPYVACPSRGKTVKAIKISTQPKRINVQVQMHVYTWRHVLMHLSKNNDILTT